MSDVLTVSIITVLGKYAIDKGATLAKEVGPQAAEKAGAIFKAALAYLRRDPDKKPIADRYEQNPEKAAALLQEDLAAALLADEAFADQMRQMVAEYTAAQAAAPGYQARVEGGGAAAQGEGATAVGAGGVNIQDSTSSGPIITGSGHTITYGGGSAQLAGRLPQNLAGLRDKLIRYFNKSELKGLSFDLGIRHEDLPGETLSELAQALVIYCEQRDRLPELVQLCRRERPLADWG